MSPSTKKLIGALVAAALAIAVFYGVIGQQQATSIQNQTNQALGTGSPTQQATPQSNNAAATTPAAPAGGAAPNASATPRAGTAQGETSPPPR